MKEPELKDAVVGAKIVADFSYERESGQIDTGELLREIHSRMWIIRFEKRGLMLANIEISEDDDLFPVGKMFINPTPAGDYSDDDRFIVNQLDVGDLVGDQDTEGGVFQVISLEPKEVEA